MTAAETFRELVKNKPANSEAIMNLESIDSESVLRGLRESFGGL